MSMAAAEFYDQLEDDAAVSSMAKTNTPEYDERCQLWYAHHHKTWKPDNDAAAEALITKMLEDEDGDCLEEEDTWELEQALKEEADKRPGFVIYCHVMDQIFEIPVGKGKQTFKWLSLVCMERYRKAAKNQGRLRSRESGALLQGQFTPIQLTTPTLSNDKFVDPSLQLRQVLEDGDHVQVVLDCDRTDLARAYQLRHYKPHMADASSEAPVLIGRFDELLRKGNVSPFKGTAFNRSTEAMEMVKREQRAADSAKRRASVVATAGAAQLLLGGQGSLVSEAAIDAAFDVEWGLFDFAVFLPIKREQDQMYPIMRRYYLDLRNVFKYYCQLGESDGESDGTLGKEEFVAFCEGADILDDNLMKMKDLDKVFERVNTEVVTTAGGGMFKMQGDAKFNRSEFLEALIHISMMKFDKMFDDDPSSQFEHLMKNFVVPHAITTLPEDASSKYRDIISTPDNAMVLLDHYEMLRDIFFVYSGELGDVHGAGAASAKMVRRRSMALGAAELKRRRDEAMKGGLGEVDFGELFAIMQASGLHSEKNLPRKVLRQLFLDSQAENFDVATVEKQDESELTKMSFSEFVECIVRCADVKWRKTRVTWATKLLILMRFLERAAPGYGQEDEEGGDGDGEEKGGWNLAKSPARRRQQTREQVERSKHQGRDGKK